jgi:hypothetical protein
MERPNAWKLIGLGPQKDTTNFEDMHEVVYDLDREYIRVGAYGTHQDAIWMYRALLKVESFECKVDLTEQIGIRDSAPMRRLPSSIYVVWRGAYIVEATLHNNNSQVLKVLFLIKPGGSNLQLMYAQNMTQDDSLSS